MNYDEIFKEIINYLDTKGHIVLATSKDDKVSARNVSHIMLDNDLYFQTDNNFKKVEQIQANNNVALCTDNYQLEGIATILGNPFEDQNRQFLEKFRKVHKNSFEKYTYMESEVVVKVKIKKATIWRYINDIPYIDYLNVDERLFVRNEYKIQ